MKQSRRDFVQRATLLASAVPLAKLNLGAAAAAPQAQPAAPAATPRPELPRQVVPEGQYYETEIPDTLDLAARADLAVHGILNTIDPELMTMFGLIYFNAKTPFLQHWSADIPLDAKFAESLPLLRLMCGSNYLAPFEQEYRQELVSRIDDGLYWDRFTSRRPWRNVYNNSIELYGAGRDEDFSSVWGVARMIRALTAWQGANGTDTAALNASLIRGLRRIAVDRGDYSYFPHRGGWHDGFIYPRSGWIDTSEAERDREGPEGSVTCAQGHQIYAAAQCYALTGDPVAKELASRVARYVMKPKFWGGMLALDPANPAAIKVVPSGPFRDGSQHGHWTIHFHARAIALRGLLYYATACDDDRALEFVRSAYEFTLTQGIPRMGLINTYPPSPGCEGCAIGDLVGLGIRLTDAGAGDYWDDVDAVVRNQLAEQQITDAAALAAYSAAQPEVTHQAKYPASYLNTRDVIPRSLGVFFGTSKPTMVTDPWVMHCCTSNASQGLYYAWEGALRENDGATVVNLLLNRAGRCVDVHSHLPHEGRVDIVVKQAPGRVSIRIPRWVKFEAVALTTNGKPQAAERLGRYLTVRHLSPGDTLTVTFPIAEHAYSYVINKGTPTEEAYDCLFRGSTLVSIHGGPALRTNDFPLYRNRELLRTNRAPRKKVTRFVAQRQFTAW
ncbi:MAG: hypothetical protein WCL24_05270 [Verrucomicrobiota bacterium]